MNRRASGGTSGGRRRGGWRKVISDVSIARDTEGSGAVRDPRHVRTHLAREPGDPAVVCQEGRPHREVQGRTPMTDDRRKSDTAVVPEKSRNVATESVADATEGRAVAKGNSPGRNGLRTQR